jgi:hypothetical protein
VQNLPALRSPPPGQGVIPPSLPHLSANREVASIGVYSPKSAIQPANPKSMRLRFIRSLYLCRLVGGREGDGPVSRSVDAVAVRRLLDNVHCGDGEVAVVLLQLWEEEFILSR